MSHPLQSPAWEQFRTSMGIDVVRLTNWLVTFHKIPFTPWTIGYFPKGPMPTRKILATLATLGREKNAIFVQIEPNATRSPSRSQSPPGRWPQDSFQVVPSHHPLFTKYTFVLDLTRPEDELLKAMHPKTRYNIKVAQKHGVVVKENNNAFETYLSLTKETTQRQKFFAHNEIYHRTMWKIMHEAGIAHLFTATYQKKILCAWIVFIYGDTIYYPYGASSREHREVMAPTLMLWEIARWAKKKGLKKFDLWGADSSFGFHRFKEGFSPQLVEFVGSYDLILKPFLYRLYTIADKIRWKILR